MREVGQSIYLDEYKYGNEHNESPTLCIDSEKSIKPWRFSFQWSLGCGVKTRYGNIDNNATAELFLWLANLRKHEKKDFEN